MLQGPPPVLPASTGRALLAGFQGVGLDAEAIREAAGIRPEELVPLDGVLEAGSFGRMWQEAFRRAPRHELPTEVGLAIPFGAFGALDYLAASAATVEAAFQSLASHFRYVAAGFTVEAERIDGGGEVRLVHQCRFEGREVSDEFTLATFVGRFSASPTEVRFQPGEVRLTRPAPERPTRHAQLLGAPVLFGCSAAALRVPGPMWNARLQSADPSLQETLRQLAARLELGAPSSDLESAIRARLRTLLPGGSGDAPTVARALGMSERTLHRKLRAAGRTFQEVLDGFREAEAERLLA
jgi:AraC-like DNA-binding protein